MKPALDNRSAFLRRVLLPAFVASFAAPALAADPPIYAPPPPLLSPIPVAYSWTGFYAGANLGGAWGQSCSNITPTFTGIGAGWTSPACPSNDGTFIGGGQVGYNFQSNAFVFGVEADLQGLSNGKSNRSATFAGIAGVPAGTYSISGSHNPNLFGTVRLRLGYAADRFLMYITGGLAYGDGSGSSTVSYTPAAGGSPTANFTGSHSASGYGWTIGAGVEYAATSNWSLRAEYLYADLGNASGTLNTCNNLTAAATCATFNPGLTWSGGNRRLTENIVRIGVNYKFGGPSAPVISKY